MLLLRAVGDGESACKRDSVHRAHCWDPIGGHPSVRSTWGDWAGRPSHGLTLLRVGFAEPPGSPRALVRSYRTVSPLPVVWPRQPGNTPIGGLFSVALSCGSPRLAVSQHPALRSPDFPRPGQGLAATTRPTHRLHQYRTTPQRFLERSPICGTGKRKDPRGKPRAAAGLTDAGREGRRGREGRDGARRERSSVEEPRRGPAARPFLHFDGVGQLLLDVRRMRHNKDLAETTPKPLERPQHAGFAFLVERAEDFVEH
jgi:hypothetical protein